MPRDGSGVASKPAGTTASPDTTIESSKFNSVIDDIYADMNLARPITAGGTGASNAAAARTALGLGSLATYDIGQVSAKTANCLINPLFEVNQRGVSGAVTLAAGEYGHDRWKAGAAGCSYTFASSGNGGGYTITITSGSLLQRIEVQTFAGRLGDYVLSWSGTAQARIDGGAYGDSGAVTAAIVGSNHVSVEFGTGTVSVPQLEAGVTPTAFSRRHPAQEMGLCQRYFNRLTLAAQNCIPITYRGTKIAGGVYHHPVLMRGAPTVSYTGTPDIYGMGSENLSNMAFYPGQMFTAIQWNDVGSPFTAAGGYGLGGADFILNFDAEL